MKGDQILVRMPERLDYFLAATAVLQDYCAQLHKQAAMKQRPADFWFTVELANDGQLFFWPMFPRMKFALRGEVSMARSEWSCVMDFTDIERVWKVAEVPHKHITEAWGIMFGASPKILPGLGPMEPRGAECPVDVLLDERVPVKEQVCRYFSTNYPEANVKVVDLEGVRPSTLFQLLVEAKMFLGMRGDGSYLAATMGKPTLELYPDDVPLWWTAKPQDGNYRILYGGNFGLEIVWAVAEEMYRQAAGCEEEMAVI